MKKVDIPELGKFIRKIRIDNEETGPQMGERLGVSKSYISSVELGKRLMSDKIKRKFIKEYKLSENQIAKLDELIYSQSKRINITGMNKSDIKLILALSKNIKNMSNEDKTLIKEIIYKKEKEE